MRLFMFGIAAQCLPSDRQLQYPVRPLDEDQGFLPAAVEGGSVDVDQLVAHLQLLAHGRLPAILDLQKNTANVRNGKESQRNARF